MVVNAKFFLLVGILVIGINFFQLERGLTDAAPVKDPVITSPINSESKPIPQYPYPPYPPFPTPPFPNCHPIYFTKEGYGRNPPQDDDGEEDLNEGDADDERGAQGVVDEDDTGYGARDTYDETNGRGARDADVEDTDQGAPAAEYDDEEAVGAQYAEDDDENDGGALDAGDNNTQ
ncbi:uncharacterized protein LOC124159834 [Ischnura elegans]|uniref:uncharacterized protein LOC124159834 n=1 Tax=Ischnura elegans TaxID=197161 RepID=UPI001ED8692B|nr:uncharacterized protein LOC124159834 [Ischnura elegans]